MLGLSVTTRILLFTGATDMRNYAEPGVMRS
jgi:hypothetical protein